MFQKSLKVTLGLLLILGFVIYLGSFKTGLNEGGQQDEKVEGDTLGENVFIGAETKLQKLIFRVYPEARVPITNNWDTIVEFRVKPKGSTNTIVGEDAIVTDTQGVGQLSISTLEVIPSRTNLDVTVKGFSHLRKRYYNVFFDKVSMDINLTYDELLAGDTHDSNDNYINSLDMSTVINTFFSDNYKNDLNQDGEVNSLDFSIQIRNLWKTGDV